MILASLLSAIFGGIVVFSIHLLLARKQRREAARDLQKRAREGLLMELQSHQDLANRPWDGRMVSFSTDAWKAYKGEVSRFPTELPDVLRRHYMEVDEVNAIVLKDIQLGHGRGYLDETYKKQCARIAESAGGVIGLFEDWQRLEPIKYKQKGANDAKS
jgi:hypothetical protein